MTRNQIEYQKNLETERANRVSEGLRESEQRETNRHNVAQEQETVRHNTASEGTETYKATSVDAHYRRLDDTQLQQLAETIAHNKVNELQSEARLRFDADYGMMKLRNDIYTALLRGGGTWQSVLALAGSSLDQIMNGFNYDPFANVTGVGNTRDTTSTPRKSVSAADYAWDRGSSSSGGLSVKPADTQSTTTSKSGTTGSLSQGIKSGTSGLRDVMDHVNDSLASTTTGSQMEVRQTIHLSPYETQKAIEKAQKDAGRVDKSVVDASKRKQSQVKAVDDIWSRHS